MPSGRLVPVTGRWGPAVRAELAATDWERTPVVDAVTYAPASGRGPRGRPQGGLGTSERRLKRAASSEEDQQRTEVYRHGEAPSLDLYETAERSFRVERVTRPLYERL